MAVADGRERARITHDGAVWPELTKRPNFTYRVKIDISASAEKPQVANFRTTGQTDRVYRTVSRCLCALEGIDPNPCRKSCVFRRPPISRCSSFVRLCVNLAQFVSSGHFGRRASHGPPHHGRRALANSAHLVQFRLKPRHLPLGMFGIGLHIGDTARSRSASSRHRPASWRARSSSSRTRSSSASSRVRTACSSVW